MEVFRIYQLGSVTSGDGETTEDSSACNKRLHLVYKYVLRYVKGKSVGGKVISCRIVGECDGMCGGKNLGSITVQ